MKASGFIAHPALYSAFLEATWRARRELENALDEHRAGRLFALWPRRRIAELIRLDFVDVMGREIEGRDEHRGQWQLTDAEVFGVLYVLEGSSLGARIVARAAGELGFTPDRGARHLAHQTGCPNAWKSFQSELEKFQMCEAGEELCISAARRTFGLFEENYMKAKSSS